MSNLSTGSKLVFLNLYKGIPFSFADYHNTYKVCLTHSYNLNYGSMNTNLIPSPNKKKKE